LTIAAMLIAAPALVAEGPVASALANSQGTAPQWEQAAAQAEPVTLAALWLSADPGGAPHGAPYRPAAQPSTPWTEPDRPEVGDEPAPPEIGDESDMPEVPEVPEETVPRPPERPAPPGLDGDAAEPGASGPS
jgi:hypothetical protein